VTFLETSKMGYPMQFCFVFFKNLDFFQLSCVASHVLPTLGKGGDVRGEEKRGRKGERRREDGGKGR
jgi:hypothetical protein